MSNNLQKNIKLVLEQVPGADESIIVELLNEVTTVDQVVSRLQSGDRSTVWTKAKAKSGPKPAQKPFKTENTTKKPYVKRTERPQREVPKQPQEPVVIPQKPASPWASLVLVPMNQQKPAAKAQAPAAPKTPAQPEDIPVKPTTEEPVVEEKTAESPAPVLEKKPEPEQVPEPEPVKVEVKVEVEEVKEVVIVEEAPKPAATKPKSKPANVLRLPASIASLRVKRDNFGIFGRHGPRASKAAPKEEVATKAAAPSSQTAPQPPRPDMIQQPYFTYVPIMIDPAVMEAQGAEGAQHPFMMPPPMGPMMMPPPQQIQGENGQMPPFPVPPVGAMPYPYPFFPYGAPQPPMNAPQ